MAELVAGLEPYPTRVGQARLTCFKPRTSHIKTIVNFALDRISCLERMYTVYLMMKMCQIIQRCEGYTQINRK